MSKYLHFPLLFGMISCGVGLVCYDNIHNDGEMVQIGCNFPGGACAVTTKTISTERSRRKNITIFYHCADRETTCKYGPVLECESQENVKCHTSCCDSDGCNLPRNGTLLIKPSHPPALTKECYQIIGQTPQVVKCLFEDAKCLYVEVSQWPQLLTGKYAAQFTQYCATRKQCDNVQIDCEDIAKSAHLYGRTCSWNCCDNDRCNRLPSSMELPSGNDDSNVDQKKFRYTWLGPKNYLTATTTQTTTSTESERYDDGQDDWFNSWNGIKIWVRLGISLASVIVFIGIIILTRMLYRKRKYPDPPRSEVRYNEGERLQKYFNGLEMSFIQYHF